jgi:1-deoxy-D-xylulose-5-phosphate synthase
MHKLLSKIKSPKELKKLNLKELNKLSQEIRDRIIKILSVNGGHLSSNLGIVELTIALHFVFDSPYDKFLFDTSHQTYTHKILTGRNENFHTLRQFKGISGFSHPEESAHDHFFAGHAGATFSTSLGLAKTRDFSELENHIIPILGDASFTCGLTLEALNNIPKNLKNFVVILNDNKMAISKSVGNIKNILSRLINSPTCNKFYKEILKKLSKVPKCGNVLAHQGQKITESIKNLVSPATFFEQFGLSYVGPIDGHNIKKLIGVMNALKSRKNPVIIHTITTKGFGLNAAKNNPTSYHGVKSFDVDSGKFYISPDKGKTTFPKIFGKFLVKMAEKDKDIIAITPAMLSGSSLVEFSEKFKNRCFDVGIAEGHCITFAGGLAYKKRKKVVACVYSTFLQRAFDNVFHDICLQDLSLILAIDRAGFSGPDGTTHHGIYDIGFLNSMPNMVITQPRDGTVLKELMLSAFSFNKPFAIRYPNLITEEKESPLKKRELGKAEILLKGEDILIIALGHHCKTALEVNEILREKNVKATIVDPIFIKPLDKTLFLDLLSSHKFVITIEEHSLKSGFGFIFNSFVIENNLKNDIMNFAIPDIFIQHGKNQDLLEDIGLTPEKIAKKIVKKFELEKSKVFV